MEIKQDAFCRIRIGIKSVVSKPDIFVYKAKIIYFLRTSFDEKALRELESDGDASVYSFVMAFVCSQARPPAPHHYTNIKS